MSSKFGVPDLSLSVITSCQQWTSYGLNDASSKEAGDSEKDARKWKIWK
jgi:hypothetical protein